MEKSLIIAGFGGQGVMVIGQLLAYTAFETTDKKVTYFPSYGAEQRGGTANCFVVISDQDIGAPKVNMADYLVVLNQPSMERFSESVKNGGALFVNSSIVTDIPQYRDIDIVPVETGNIAAELGMALEVYSYEWDSLIAAVQSGEIAESDIDAHVFRVLHEKQALGLID